MGGEPRDRINIEAAINKKSVTYLKSSGVIAEVAVTQSADFVNQESVIVGRVSPHTQGSPSVFPLHRGRCSY